MASSLPVVASDWNGYRDLVVHGSTGWLVPCRDLLQVQRQPDALDRRFNLGLQDYDSNVGLRSLGVVLDHVALEKALKRSIGRSENAALPWEKRGRERIESVFDWRVVSKQYRELWSELDERRASARQHGDAHPWPMAHTARLFATHASGPPSSRGPGGWPSSSDPNLLTDAMQTCFLQQLMPIHSLSSLAENLEGQTPSRGGNG